MSNEIGITDKGTLKALSSDINGLIKYVEVLVSGKGKATEGQPLGNIPFISIGLGVNFTEFKDLIQGTMGNLNDINPFFILQSFLSEATPPYQEITMQTIDINNNSSETHYVTLTDIQNFNPWNLKDKINPITKNRYKEEFTKQEIPFPDDPFVQLYFAGLGGLGIYILYKIMEKSK